MKYRVQRGTKEGALAPEGWREIEAKDMQAAAVAHLRTLHPVREDYPITVYVSDDTRLHPNGTPMEVHGYRFEAVSTSTTPTSAAKGDPKRAIDYQPSLNRNDFSSLGAWKMALYRGTCEALRAEGIPHSPAQYDPKRAFHCLTCGETFKCPGVHTFEEIQAADRAQKGRTP